MKKMIALACATSVLALASGASAADWSIVMSGQVLPSCSINATPTVSAGGSTTGTTTTFNYAPSDFSALGVTKHLSGNVQFTSVSTGNCQFSATSGTGALTGSSHTIGYTAGIIKGTTPALAAPAGANAALNGSPATKTTSGADIVTVGFEIASGQTADVDSYTETLSISITPVA
jgi:hypothetical protein